MMGANAAPRLIKSPEDHASALVEIRRLMKSDPDPQSPDGQRLELLAHLVEHYESRTFRIPEPTPLEALKFRMEQQGLKARDLVPFFGSRARVSEVLAGRRPLNLQMLQVLHAALRIPAESLIRDASASAIPIEDVTILPLNEMARRGWISSHPDDNHPDLAAAGIEYVHRLTRGREISSAFRRRLCIRGSTSHDRGSRLAWTFRVLLESRNMPQSSRRQSRDDIRTLMHDVLTLSARKDGPRAAVDFLRANELPIVIEPQLKGMHLDGAALLDEDGCRVIGLTIRHDRLDNFWFTLFHELAHHLLHVDAADDAFLDDLDAPAAADPREVEADLQARAAMIPEEVWRPHEANMLGTKQAVMFLAQQLGISPSIVAERVRHERKKYRLLTTLVGHGGVRSCFPETTWVD